MKNTKKKIIVGNWVAEIGELRTQEHNNVMRECSPDYTSEYPVWEVRDSREP